MTTKDWFETYPSRQIKPVDGMAVTAAVWQEAHDYHRQVQRFHNLLGHGPGIIAGLEVIASEPADTFVNIMPGIAIGVDGDVIVVQAPVAYDLGAAQGDLLLSLTYGQSPPRPDDDGILYVHDGYGMEVLPLAGGGTGVELARVHRQGGDALLRNAADPAQPGRNEIDLRFRRLVGASSRPVATMAVCAVGGAESEEHNRGAVALGESLRQSGAAALEVDKDVSLTDDLTSYTLVYLVVGGTLTLRSAERDALRAFVQGGGTVFVEPCRRQEQTPSADALASALEVQLQEVQRGHPLLTSPHLFAVPPAGFGPAEEGQLLAADGVVWSGCDYGCLWQGERQDGVPSREEIRAAHEWGHNLVAYALRRREA